LGVHFCEWDQVAYIRYPETISGELIVRVSVDQVTTARVGYLIKRAQTVLHDAMADALGSHELTVTEFAVLTALDDEPGLSNADLARRAFVTPQSMHAVLQELERLQFVVRRPHPQHQRVLQAELTEAGRRTLKSANNSVNAVEEQMLRQLSIPARLRLAGALSSCIDSLAEAPASSGVRRLR
jgi:DNA-binding MarR family transcriptional regulator